MRRKVYIFMTAALLCLVAGCSEQLMPEVETNLVQVVESKLFQKVETQLINDSEEAGISDEEGEWIRREGGITPESAAAILSQADRASEEVIGLFRPVIEAYEELEQSEYLSFDEELIGDSVLTTAEGSTYNFGWDNKPVITYAFYDLNEDGIPELLVGTGKSIAGIYAVQDGKAMSVLQVEDRWHLRLLRDDAGNCVIGHSWGRMGHALEYYYKLSESGEMVILDILHTNGDVIEDGEFVGHFRTRETDGSEADITEEAYFELIQKYGSRGYEPLPDAIEHEREIEVVWGKVF